VRLVSNVGTFWFRDKHVFLSKALTGERIGLRKSTTASGISCTILRRSDGSTNGFGRSPGFDDAQ
jgi:hypothetical protein